MQAVVLAAGEGTRLRPLTVERPKVMLPVARRPVVTHLIEALVEAGIRDIVLVVGYKREKVQAHLGDGDRFGADITYVVQERQLGTAHALGVAEDEVEAPFLVVAGDNISAPSDLEQVATSRETTLLIQDHDQPGQYGAVRLAGGDVVEAIVEKPDRPASNLVATGVYRFDETVFDTIAAQAEEGVNDLTSVVNAMIDGGHKVRTVRGSGAWLDVVYPWDLLHVNARIIDREPGTVDGTVEQDVVLKGPVTVGEGTTLHPGTVIQGPVTIGEGCEIGPHAVVDPATSIGDNVTLGAHGYVRNSVVMDNVHAGPGLAVEDSILAEGVRLGSQVSLVSGSPRVLLDDRVFDLERFGTVVGEDADLGSHVVVEPGTFVGARARAAGGARVADDVPDEGRVV